MAVGLVHGSIAAASLLVIQFKAKPCGVVEASDVTLGVMVSIMAVIAAMRFTDLHALKGAVVGAGAVAGDTVEGVPGTVGAGATDGAVGIGPFFVFPEGADAGAWAEVGGIAGA
jgi:hypothetical protein